MGYFISGDIQETIPHFTVADDLEFTNLSEYMYKVKTLTT